MADFVSNIQWKGTNLCMDFWCPKCGEFNHYDGFFMFEIECDGCDTIWTMPTDIFSLMVERPPKASD